MQFLKFREYVEAQDAGGQKCEKCGVCMDTTNPNRTLRVLEDPKGGLVGMFCPTCYDTKKKELTNAQTAMPREFEASPGRVNRGGSY